MYTDQQLRTMTRGELEDLRRRTLSELVRRDRGIYDLPGLKIMANQYKKDTIRLEVEFDITPGVIRYSREVEEYIMKAATPGRDVPVLSTKEELLKRAAVCQNESKKDFSATSKRDAREFLRYARSLGLPATLRPSRGQLAAKDLRRRPAVSLSL